MAPPEPRPRADLPTLISTVVSVFAVGLAFVAWYFPRPAPSAPATNMSAAPTPGVSPSTAATAADTHAVQPNWFGLLVALVGIATIVLATLLFLKVERLIVFIATIAIGFTLIEWLLLAGTPVYSQMIGWTLLMLGAAAAGRYTWKALADGRA